MAGMRSRNCLPAICHVGPAALGCGSVSGTQPRRIVTCGEPPGDPGINPGRAISLATDNPDTRYKCTREAPKG
jgi:hypothetical protein